jgi:hypothetical protein
MSLKALGIETPEEFGPRHRATCADYLRRNNCGDTPLGYRFVRHYLTTHTTTPAVEVFGEKGSVTIGYDWKLLAVSSGWSFPPPAPPPEPVAKLNVRIFEPGEKGIPAEFLYGVFDFVTVLGDYLTGFRGDDAQVIAEILRNPRLDAVAYLVTVNNKGRMYRGLEIKPVVVED